MNFLRVSFAAASHKTFRHILRYAVSSNANTMIRGFATASANLESEQVVEKVNCVSDNTLISDMSKAEDLSRTVVEVLDRKGLSPNETTFTSLIDSLCKQDRFAEAYKVLNEMIVTGFSPSEVTVENVLCGLLRIGDMRKAFEMRMKFMYEHNYEWWMMDDDTESSLLRGVSYSYDSLINAYLDEGNWDYADELYYLMDKYVRRGDPALYSVFINGLDDNKARTTQIKKKLLRFNYEMFLSFNRPIFEYHRTLAENCSNNEFKSLVELVEGLCSRGLENAHDTILLKSIDKPNGIDDGIVYNLFIMAHCKHSNVDEAYNMYKDMVHYGFPCHMFTVFALIKTLQGENMVDEIRWVIQNVLRSCNLNDSEIVKFLNEFNPKKPHSEAFFDVLAEKAKNGLFLKFSYPPASA